MNEGVPKEIRGYKTADGRRPFWDWLFALKDKQARRVLLNRVERFMEGNPGQWRSIGNGVCELKISLGPGYRIYYGEVDKTLVILLCGGDKSSQQRDIEKAYHYWADYKRRTYGTESQLS